MEAGMLDFRRASVEDIDELIKAKIDAFADDVKKHGFAPVGYDDYEIEKENIQNNHTYKIVLSGKIIGGITCIELGNGIFRINELFIEKQYQNMGFGTKAIYFIEREFPKARKWRLQTPYKSFRSQHFYEKIGYRKTNEIPASETNKFVLYEYEKTI